MNQQAFKRLIRGVSLTAIALFAGAFAATGSAAAASQHWATATSAGPIPPGGEQSFVGKNQTTVQMSWRVSGIRAEISCATLSSSGIANNPAGGEAGELGSTSLEAGRCALSTTHCQLRAESIHFEALKGYARSEGDEKDIVFEPNTGTAMAVIHPEGAECPLASELTVSGYFEAAQVPSHPGIYQVANSHLKIGTAEFGLVTEISLSTSSGQSLSLFSEGSLGPHWYFGGAEWTTSKAGEAINYWNSASVPLTLNTKVGLINVEINQCEGFINGSVVNPVGGGAGTASATYTPGWVSGCEVHTNHCHIESSGTSKLSGVATEVGGVPAIEWSPSVGTAVMVFQIGGSECPLPNTLTVTGKLIATSEGDGRFSIAGSELRVGNKNATASGEFGLETQPGNPLRLQP
jgi:hypothetical protein